MRVAFVVAVALVAAVSLNAQVGQIPEGFTPIFNGENLDGWHVSKTSHHGTTPEFRVVHSVIVGTQNPRGQGGILLTDKRYKNFEVYMEVWPDFGCDSGLFVRSNEAGDAYQIMMDYLEGGNLGGIYGEGLKGVTDANAANLSQEERRAANQAWQKIWKREAWNSIRARVEGDVPHIQVWMNGEKITDFQDTENHAADEATDGMIAIQMHYTNENTNRWVDGGFWRWRNLAVRVLPD